MKYRVYVEEVHLIPVEVEAESEDHARKLANECIEDGYDMNGDALSFGEYSHTLDPEGWTVSKL